MPKINLELIPVIEITYYDEGIETPGKGLCWEYPQIWDNFNKECLQKAGFKDVLKPNLAGSSFYKLTDISDNNLAKIVIDQTKEMRNGDYNREQASPFYGGYVLRIDNENIYFPQCCADLSDIHYWEGLLEVTNPFFWQGHPGPLVEIKSKIIIFDFSIDEHNQHFVPPLKYNKIEFDKSALESALRKVRTELNLFAERVLEINIKENLNIENIDKLLIWGDTYDSND